MGSSCMNKYLAVLIGVCLSLNASANSYVFGGRAHFNGALVGSGCVIVQENNLSPDLLADNKPVLKLDVSNCSPSVYYNLVIVMKYISNNTNISLSQVMSGEHSGLSPEREMRHSISLIGYPNKGEIPEGDTEYKTVVLPLPIEKNQLPDGNANILISIFYP